MRYLPLLKLPADRCSEGQGNAQVSETNSENIEVGKRVAEYNIPNPDPSAFRFRGGRGGQAGGRLLPPARPAEGSGNQTTDEVVCGS